MPLMYGYLWFRQRSACLTVYQEALHTWCDDEGWELGTTFTAETYRPRS